MTIQQDKLMESWGPLGTELIQAKLEVETELVQEVVEKEEDEDDAEDDFEEFDDDELDVGLIERIDALDLNDNVREMESVNDFGGDM